VVLTSVSSLEDAGEGVAAVLADESPLVAIVGLDIGVACVGKGLGVAVIERERQGLSTDPWNFVLECVHIIAQNWALTWEREEDK